MPDGLYSVGVQGYRWRSGPLKAECRSPFVATSFKLEPLDYQFKDQCDVSPGEKCNCGFVAFNDILNARQEFMHLSNCIIGTVALWGKVISHEHGRRAQHAQILGLLYNPSRLFTTQSKMAEQYHIPLEADAESLFQYSIQFASPYTTEDWMADIGEPLKTEEIEPLTLPNTAPIPLPKPEPVKV